MDALFYVKELLFLNDCVIIPGFGGFVCTYQPAQVSGTRFTPPGKTIRFNRKLNFNDGLFISYLADRKGIQYVQAGIRISQLVDEMNCRLVDGETVNIPAVGTLVYDDHENLIFTPTVEENLNPDAFGLPAFCQETLSPASRIMKAIPPGRRDAAQVLFHKRTYRKVFVVAPLLLALALTPLKNKTDWDIQRSGLGSLQEMMWQGSLPAKPEITGSEEGPAQEYAAGETALAENILPGTAGYPDAAASAGKTEIAEEYGYFMIGGVFRDEKNAHSLVEQMKHTGYPARIIAVRRGMHWVALDSFPTQELALTGLKDYFAQNPGSDAWIYTRK